MKNEYDDEININNNENNIYSYKKKEKIFTITEPNFYNKKSISKTMKNMGELSSNTKKVKRYSINIRNELTKKMEKKQKLFEKQIYTPLYTQIHKSLREIENEIKIAQQYVIPDKEIIKRKIRTPLYNAIFKLKQNINPNNNLLLNNNEKNNTNFYFKPEKSKSSKIKKKLNNKNNLFIRTFSNDLNNKTLFRNRDKNKTKKTVSFPLNIESYKERFNIHHKNDKYDDEETKNNIFNDFDYESKSNILSPKSTNIPIITKKSSALLKFESKDLSSKNSALNIYSKNFNSFTQDVKTNNEDMNKNINKVRYKTYYVEYQPEWYLKNKFIKNRFDKTMIINPLFQKKIIDDELALLFENMKIFQSQYLIDKNLSKHFNKISWYTQRELNCNLEEAIGLLTEISYLLLNGYDNIIQNFISNPIPRITKKKIKNVFNEKQEFILNISAFSETFVFLKVCYEAYVIISSSKEEFYISSGNFEILHQYLDRARFVVSKICLDLKNMYKEQNKEDKKIIEDCLKKIKNVNRKALINNLKILNNNIKSITDFNIKGHKKKIKNLQYKSKVDCHQKFGLFNSGINSFRYKGPKKIKLSEEHLTNLRINKAFGSISYREMRPSHHFAKFDINSKLVNQLMKYATNEFKSRIISERIRQRFISSEIDS